MNGAVLPDGHHFFAGEARTAEGACGGVSCCDV